MLVTLSVPAMVKAQPIDPEATRLLKRMSDYMAALPAFSADSENTLEAVLESGQRIQFDMSTRTLLRRPDNLRVERNADIVQQVFYYNGKTLTLYNPSDKFYATASAPDTIDAALDFARSVLDVIAPASDLMYQDSYSRLMADVTSAIVVGKAAIGGVKCNHLAFSGPQVDFQIWIAEGDRPLPRKYVITTKDVKGWPQYSVVLSNWNLAPNVSESQFNFVPPQGARKIEFLQMSRAGQAGR